MKKIIKKFWILAILLSVGLSGYAYDFEVDGICYGKNSDGKTVNLTVKEYNYNSYSGSVVIPSKVTYSGTTYSVTSIGDLAFKGCSGLTSVTIPNSVTSIGVLAFMDCSGLTSVTIPNSVTSIGFRAFSGCSGLTSVTIPNSVTSIGVLAFMDCNGLTSVTIPNSVTSIGERAFYGTAWYNNQPDGLVYAGKVAYKYKGTMPNNTSIIINDGTLGIAVCAFESCSGLTSVTIPNSVTSIGERAFSGCSGLTLVTIGNSVTSIGNSAFRDCSGLTSVTIPNSVTSIGDYAFDNCSGLTSVTIGNSITSIGVDAFSGTAWYNNQPNGLVYAGKVAYKYKGTMPENTSIAIKDGTLVIASSAFENCNGLTSVTIPNSVTEIGNWAFSGCSPNIRFVRF